MSIQQRHDELQEMESRYIRRDLHLVALIMAVVLGVIAFLYFYDQHTGFMNIVSPRLFDNLIK
ncbi:MAG: hypothetical protein V1685_06790 [Parcubacteria group bacterium]